MTPQLRHTVAVLQAGLQGLMPTTRASVRGLSPCRLNPCSARRRENKCRSYYHDTASWALQIPKSMASVGLKQPNNANGLKSELWTGLPLIRWWGWPRLPGKKEPYIFVDCFLWVKYLTHHATVLWQTVPRSDHNNLGVTIASQDADWEKEIALSVDSSDMSSLPT